MNKITICLLLTLVLTACNSGAIQIVEVTRLVPQTIEVTRVIPQPTATQESGDLATTPEPSATSIPNISQVDFSFAQVYPAYFDGFVVLTQYYTLLNHRLYEESYQLLSSSQQKRYDFEGYVNFYTHDLKSIEIIRIQPYNYWCEQQGLSALPIPASELIYVVWMTAFHNGAAWNEGGTPTPDDVTGFETLVFENNEWKIDKFSTFSPVCDK